MKIILNLLVVVLTVTALSAMPQTKIYSKVRIHVPVYRHTKYVTRVKTVPITVKVPVPIHVPVKEEKLHEEYAQWDYDEKPIGQTYADYQKN